LGRPTASVFDVPTQPLASALDAFSKVTGREIFYDGSIGRGRRSTAVEGSFMPDEALSLLLSGTNLVALPNGEILGSIEFLTVIEEVYDVQIMPDIRRPEIRDPIKWFETMSIVTPNGGFWIRNPLQQANADESLRPSVERIS
jgi:hypothetical protein